MGTAAPTIQNCVIVGNEGAGVSLETMSKPLLENCLIAANTDAGIAMSRTAGRRSNYSQPLIRQCTIIQNQGPGLRDGQPTLSGCIVYYNGADAGNTQLDDMQAKASYCCIQEETVGVENITQAPAFLRLGEFDEQGQWQPGDYQLSAVSPCIDAGDPEISLDTNVLDLDGQPRIVNERIDMGAYEYLP